MNNMAMRKLSAISCITYLISTCSGGQGEFNEITPEFIGEMVYS